MLWDRCPVCLSCLSCNVGVLWPSRWMGQNATWYGGRLRPRRHCVRWEHSSPKGAQSPPPIFSPCLLWPNGWIDHDDIWYAGTPRPRRHCVRWGPSCPLRKGHSSLPSFRLMSIVDKQLDESRCHLVWREVGLGPGHAVLDGDPSPQKEAQQSPIFGPRLFWPNGWMDQDATWYGGRRHCTQQIPLF